MGSSPKRKTQGWKVIRWIEAHCVFTAGRWIGKPFRLRPWQKRLLLRLFETNPKTGLRLFRWALIGMPKKQGKTELCAALAMYFLIGDGEPSPLVACAAASEEQADLVFGACKVMATMSPTLSLVCEVFEKEIQVPSIPGAKLIRVAAAAGTNDGKNLSCVICDELHEWTGEKGEKVWNVLTNGIGARKQPMILQITTAGYDRNTVCYRQYKHGRRVAAGLESDPTYFFYWIEAPKDSDWQDPKVWEAANPNYNVTVGQEFYEDQIRRKPENVFRRYFLNQWTQSAESWLPSVAWARNRVPGLHIVEFAPVHIGVDIGIVQDSTAVCWVWRDGGQYKVRVRIFTPPGDGTELELGEVEHFIGGGGDTIPGDELPLAERFKIQSISYDPHMFAGEGQRLSERFVVIKFPQTDERMSPATKVARELIIANRVKWDHPDDEFEEHVLAGVLRQTDRGYRLSKRKATGRTDACVAMVMALYEAAGDETDFGFD